MTLKRTALATLAACALGTAGLAAAQPMMGPPMEGGWHAGGLGGGDLELLRGLTLTSTQKEQAHAVLKSAWSGARPWMEQLHTLHEQYITLLLTAGSTREQLASVQHQEDSLRNRMDASRLDVALQLRALLTPQQLAQAADLHSKLEALREQERQAIGSSVLSPE